jgi:predicted ArsR family transcriptional regulator
MDNEPGHIVADADSTKKRAKILEFLMKRRKPKTSLAEIAQAIHATERETQQHLDALGEDSRTDYIRRNRIWGYVFKDKPKSS